MMKRTIAFLLLVGVLGGGMLTACQSPNAEGTPIGGTTEGATQAASPEVSSDGASREESEGTSEEPSVITSSEDADSTSEPMQTTSDEKETIIPERITGTAGGETASGTEPETHPETDAGSAAVTDSETTPETDPVPVPEVDPMASGSLLYYEDFESRAVTSANSATMNALGWELQSSADGAYYDNSATYTIVEENGNRRLKITNYTSTLTGNDSYVRILADSQFRYLHTQSFTYQYDVEYTSASDAKRYLALVSAYDGSFYNTFHLRNGGTCNNECHSAGAWKQYAKSADVRKLLGVSGSSLNGISISIRYVVDWENGCRIYGRVNGGSLSLWVLLSQYDASQNGKDYFDPSVGGAALVLKVGGAQNGYMDNIMVWSGTVETPTDTEAEPYLSSVSECHRYITVNSVKLCALCGRTQDRIENFWLLSGVPAYEGGVPSQEVYLSGQGLDPDQPRSKENEMQIVAETDESEFAAYLEKLGAEGYTREFYREADGNLFASYVKGTQRIYTYFTPAFAEARVILESTEVSVSVDAFDYTYTKMAGDTTVLYQYALPLRDASHLKSDNYVDRGMLYVVKLADNKVVIFDGGESVQFTDARLDDLMAFLREITGVGENGTVTIAAWYLTHAH